MRRYIRNSQDAGKRTAFTEIEINATPETVREKFLTFDKWSAWNTVIPKIAVTKGDINNLTSKPTLEFELDLNESGQPTKVPVAPAVQENSKDVFMWGVNLGVIFKAEHVFLFEPINNGNATRLVHYEHASGLISPLFMTSKLKNSMVLAYSRMNESLKKLCEKN